MSHFFENDSNAWCILTVSSDAEVYLEPSQTSMMELFCEIVSSHVWLGSKFMSGIGGISDKSDEFNYPEN